MLFISQEISIGNINKQGFDIAAAGLGVVVAFGGEIHAAMTVRKIDSTGPTAFGSPTAGPVGRIVERRVWLHAMPIRPKPLPVERLAHRVAVVATGLGDDWRPAQARGAQRRRGCVGGAGCGAPASCRAR